MMLIVALPDLPMLDPLCPAAQEWLKACCRFLVSYMAGQDGSQRNLQDLLVIFFTYLLLPVIFWDSKSNSDNIRQYLKQCWCISTQSCTYQTITGRTWALAEPESASKNKRTFFYYQGFLSTCGEQPPLPFPAINKNKIFLLLTFFLCFW